ncbi:MAG: hypothetical protein WAU56_07520 [Steroidobacteraceae bacterium]
MEIDVVQTVIPAGQALSPEVDIGTKSLVAISLPANWTAEAGLSFSVSFDGGDTWGELVDNTNTAITVPPVTIENDLPAQIAVNPAQWQGITALKIRSGTAADPVNQVDAVTVSLVTRLVS